MNIIETELLLLTFHNNKKTQRRLRSLKSVQTKHLLKLGGRWVIFLYAEVPSN